MRGKKAKVLRKLVYESNDYRERQYAQHKNKVITNTGTPINFVSPSGQKHHIALRRVYKRLKKRIGNLRNTALPAIILGLSK